MLHLRITLLRDQRELSQEQLAKKIGTTKQHMGRLEKGTRPLSNRWIEKISDALGVRPGELFNEMPEELAPSEKSLIELFRQVPASQQEAILQLARSMANIDPLAELIERIPNNQRGALFQLARSMAEPYQSGDASAPKRQATGTED